MTAQPHVAPTPPAHVCHVVATSHTTWMLEQLRGLRDRYGYAVSCMTGAEGALHPRLRAERIPYQVLETEPLMLPSPWRLVSRVVSLARHFRRERYDVVQTSLWHSMLLGRMAAWLADVPVRTTSVVGPFHLDAPITRWIDGSTWWMESRIIASCQSIKAAYAEIGVPEDRLALVYVGGDESEFDPDAVVPHDLRAEYGWPADTPIIALVAWFYPRLGGTRWVPRSCWGLAAKGHDDVIRAMPTVLREFPNAKAVFVGGSRFDDGERYRRDMIALVEQYDIQERVIFAGARSNVPGLYQSIDVAVHPSISEACGGARESLLMARPTVATRVGGLPDLVLDGETGVLVNPADPADLARGICALLRDPDGARALGQAGRAHALQTIILSKTVSDLDALYREALSPNGRRRAGYRWWVSLLRLPVVITLAAYLNWRLYVVEQHFLPKWVDGWRPWRPRALALLPIELLVTTARAFAPGWLLAIARGPDQWLKRHLRVKWHAEHGLTS